MQCKSKGFIQTYMEGMYLKYRVSKNVIRAIKCHRIYSKLAEIP